jgi:Calcineurin-like phosphoesterase
MLISCMSDLHLEFGDITLPGGDILILAGDTWLAAPMRDDCTSPRGMKARDRFRRFSADELSKYQKVFLVNGNHEHYGCHWSETSDIIRKFLAQNAPNATLLDDQAHEQFGFVFIGTTLWANYGFPDALQMELIRTRMSDCHSIRMTDKEGYTRCITPKDVYDQHQTSRYKIASLVKAYPSKPKILITHHAPSWLSKKFSAYPAGDMDWAYYSNFERIMGKKNKIVLAVHGHTHDNSRYRVRGTVVCSNQRGYVGYDLGAASFDPSACDVTLPELLESLKVVDETAKEAKKACRKKKVI